MFRFQLLRQKVVSAYNIAAVCYNSHVHEKHADLKSFYFNAKQIHISTFRIYGVITKFRVSF